MSQFSSNEVVSLEKRVEQISTNIQQTKPEDLNYEYDIEKCVKWIQDNNYEKVCLQFPDFLLHDSVEVAKKIEKAISKKVFILGDTTYESCCIDFTSAQHVSADAIIHFGATCLSKQEEIIPYLKIYQKYPFDVDEFYKNITRLEDTLLAVLIDTPYHHKITDLKSRNSLEFRIQSVDNSEELGNLDIKNVVYVGESNRKIINLILAYNLQNVYLCDPKISYELEKYEIDSKILKRRYFLMEKIKDSQTIAIVIGTLAVKNYLKILERVKSLVKLHSKKYYVMSVGKPTVAKLANFPEVDIYVVIGCGLNEIYESRDFYKPIVTAYDMEAALNPRHDIRQQFSYDFNQFISNNEITYDLKKEIITSDVSLVTGHLRSVDTNNYNEECIRGVENQIMLKDDGVLVASSTNFGAGYLAGKSWKGLEQNLGADMPQMAEKGRKGIAQGYENETL